MERLFPNIQARGLGLQFKYWNFFAGKNIRAVKGQWPKISMVNGQTAEKSRSEFWPAAAAVTIESMGVIPPYTGSHANSIALITYLIALITY